MGFNDFFDEPLILTSKKKQKFIDNLDSLKSMSVQEQTLYKKWLEFNADVYSMDSPTKLSKLEKGLFGHLPI